MIYGDYDRTLEALKVIGRLRCAYAGNWPDSICDCKYGGPKLQPHPEYGMNLPHEVLGEQTGCPELRTIYALLIEMGEEAFDKILSEMYTKNVEAAKQWWEENRASQES